MRTHNKKYTRKQESVHGGSDERTGPAEHQAAGRPRHVVHPAVRRELVDHLAEVDAGISPLGLQARRPVANTVKHRICRHATNKNKSSRKEAQKRSRQQVYVPLVHLLDCGAQDAAAEICARGGQHHIVRMPGNSQHSGRMLADLLRHPPVTLCLIVADRNNLCAATNSKLILCKARSRISIDQPCTTATRTRTFGAPLNASSSVSQVRQHQGRLPDCAVKIPHICSAVGSARSNSIRIRGPIDSSDYLVMLHTTFRNRFVNATYASQSLSLLPLLSVITHFEDNNILRIRRNGAT